MEQDDAVRALKAIRARINGDWDDPDLLSMGALTADEDVDILFFVTVGLGTVKKNFTGEMACLQIPTAGG